MSIPSRNVAFNKPKEPSFLKAFKAKVGYKEPATIDAKREVPKPPRDDGNEVEREDEQPTVVVLREGDVGEDEYQEFRKKTKQKEGGNKDDSEDNKTPDESSKGGKMVFRRPPKRKSSESGSDGVLGASTTKKPKQETHSGSLSGRQRRKSSGESKSKGIKNSSLLSFDDKEEY